MLYVIHPIEVIESIITNKAILCQALYQNNLGLDKQTINMLVSYCMANLIEIIKDLSDNQRQYILRRVAGINAKTSRELVGITKGTYNTWFHNETFTIVHSQLSVLEQEHKNEAVQILRRNNQLEAVLLEGEMVKRMREELDNHEYNFLRTNIAREVYSKLISDLDAAPPVKVLSWHQRVEQIFRPREVIDAEFETVSSEEEQHQESHLIEASKQRCNEDEEGSEEEGI